MICELILFVSDFWKGSQTTKRFKQSHLPPSATRVKSQGGETVFEVCRNCAVNFILTKQEKNKWKPSCKHPNHIINFKWAQNFLDTQARGDPCRKPRVSDFRAHWTSVRADRVWVKKHPQFPNPVDDWYQGTRWTMLQHEHQSRLTQNINRRYETLSYLILVHGEGWGARLAQGHTAGAGTGRTQPWLLASHPHIFRGCIKTVLTLHKG